MFDVQVGSRREKRDLVDIAREACVDVLAHGPCCRHDRGIEACAGYARTARASSFDTTGIPTSMIGT